MEFELWLFAPRLQPPNKKHRACSAGYKPTLLQLFGLLQLQSIERKIL
jgi:hypothetical protein